jgi:hypothetical protein
MQRTPARASRSHAARQPGASRRSPG